MTARETAAEPVWHVRIDVSLYVGGPVFRASVALFNDGYDRLRPSDLDPGLDHLRDFEVSASIGPSGDGSNQLWGYKHGYAEPFFVDLHRIEPMVKTLRRIEAGLGRHRAEIGDFRKDDAVGYLAAIATVLKIPTFVVRAEDGEDSGKDARWPDGRRHRVFDADELQTVVAEKVRELGDLT